MSRTKRKDTADNKQILQILQTLVRDWEKTGETFSVMNLYPTRNGLGFVFDNSWQCVKCGNYFFKDFGPQFVCANCSKEK